MAPAPVLLAGRHHDLDERGTGRAVADGDQSGAGAGGARRAQGLVGKACPTLVRDPDHEARRRRPRQELKGLRVARVGIGPEHGGNPLGGMLRRAAAGDHDRLAARCGRANRLSKRRQRGILRQAPRQPLGDRRLGGDHLGHRVGRRAAQGRHR